jgi:hypothetical protein
VLVANSVSRYCAHRQLPTAKARGLVTRLRFAHAHFSKMHARNINTRYVRLIDCSPADILRRNGVCVASVSTTDTDKEGLGAPVADAHALTLRTPAGGVARINEPDWDPKLLRFITDKALQLAEAPGMQTCPLLLLSPYPGTNPLEIFQGDPAPVRYRNGNDSLGNLMIDVTPEPLFFPAAFAQKPSGGAGAFGREPGAKPAVSCPQAVQMAAAKTVVVTGVGDCHKPKINPKPVVDFTFRRLRNFNGSKEQPQAISAKKVALTFARCKQLALALPADEGNSQPPLNAPDADLAGICVPGKDVPIEGYRTAGAKNALSSPVQFISVGHFGYEPDNDLSRKAELFPDLAIKKSLQRELVKLSSLPSQLAQLVSSSVSRAQRALQGIGLRGRWLQFDLDSQFQSPLAYMFRRTYTTRNFNPLGHSSRDCKSWASCPSLS